MTVLKRIVPCLDVNKGRVVKGKKFENVQDVADPVELAKKYNQDGADELVLYDITATTEGRGIFIDVIKNVAKEISIPFIVGGGLRTVEDIQKVLDAGADKVSISSAAIDNPQLIKDASEKFGKEAIVLAIDAKKVGENKWNAFIKGGKVDSGRDAIEWAIEGERLGAGEIVVNSIDEDGVKDGYSLELNRQISNAVSIPIIASGGAGEMKHFAEALQDGAGAALAASVFHYGEINITDLKKYLIDLDIPVKEVK